MNTPEPRSIIEGRNPRSSRTAGNRFSFRASCHNSSVTVTKPPLGTAHIVHNDVDALETIERLPDDSIRAVGDCDIGLDKIRVIAFQWFRPGRYNDGSSPRAGNAPQSVAAENSI